MRKRSFIIKIIIVVFLSLLVFFLTWFFLHDKIIENNNKNNLVYLNSVVNNFNYGEYYFKNKSLYDANGNIIEENIKIKGSAEINKTEYGIDSKYENDDICIYKTSGNSQYLTYSGECDKLNISKSKIIHSQNNSQITISGDFDFYYVGKSKNNVEKWSEKKTKDLVVNLPYEGNFYIWVKNRYGVISDVISANVTCYNEDEEEINDTLIYCIGTKINVEGYTWRVISDKNGELKLLMDSGQLDLMAQCDSDINDKYCYYKSDIMYKAYKWSDSKINGFLNSEILKKLKNYNLKEYKICDDPSGKKGCKDGDGCSGYLKEEIESLGYSCSKYTNSKIRLLTYEEYNYILNETNNKKWLYNSKIDDFWLSNGYSERDYYAFKVNKFGQVYLDARVDSLLEVRPVITIYK